MEGRTVVGELAVLDEELTRALGASLDLPTHLADRLVAKGFVPIVEDARSRVRAGDIPEGELRRLEHGVL